MVYASTIDTDRGLRDVVVDAFGKHRSSLEWEQVSEIFEEMHAITFDLLKRSRWPGLGIGIRF